MHAINLLPDIVRRAACVLRGEPEIPPHEWAMEGRIKEAWVLQLWFATHKDAVAYMSACSYNRDGYRLRPVPIVVRFVGCTWWFAMLQSRRGYNRHNNEDATP